MRFYMFEGTPEELSKVLPTLDVTPGQLQRPVASVEGSAESRIEKPNTWVSADQARVILTRRPLSKPVLKMLYSLYGAGAKRLTSGELKKTLGFNAHEFRGMLGAFGRRVGHTAPNNAQFFDQKWDHALGEYTWSLPETVRQVMRELKMGA